MILTERADGPEHDEVRYLVNPFTDVELGGDSDVTGLRCSWRKFWGKGQAPF